MYVGRFVHIMDRHCRAFRSSLQMIDCAKMEEGCKIFRCIATELAPLQWVISRCLLRCCERSNFKHAFKLATWRCLIWRTKHTNCECHESAFAFFSFILLVSKELCCHSCKYRTKKDNGCRCELSRWAMYLQKVVVWDERCAFIQYCNKKFLLRYTDYILVSNI